MTYDLNERGIEVFSLEEVYGLDLNRFRSVSEILADVYCE